MPARQQSAKPRRRMLTIQTVDILVPFLSRDSRGNVQAFLADSRPAFSRYCGKQCDQLWQLLLGRVSAQFDQVIDPPRIHVGELPPGTSASSGQDKSCRTMSIISWGLCPRVAIDPIKAPALTPTTHVGWTTSISTSSAPTWTAALAPPPERTRATRGRPCPGILHGAVHERRPQSLCPARAVAAFGDSGLRRNARGLPPWPVSRSSSRSRAATSIGERIWRFMTILSSLLQLADQGALSILISRFPAKIDGEKRKKRIDKKRDDRKMARRLRKCTGSILSSCRTFSCQ